MPDAPYFASQPTVYFMGLTEDEIRQTIDKDDPQLKYLEPEEIDVLLDHIRFEFNWQAVYEQISNIAGEWIADKDSHMGKD